MENKCFILKRIKSLLKMQGVVVFNSFVKGSVLFSQIDKGVIITIDLIGIDPLFKYAVHGFHIHTSGDLRRGCDSCCKHYNPSSKNHGGLNDKDSHAGDLGNITFNSNKICNMTLFTNKFKLKDIIGRSLIIHENEDDLGKGCNEESLKTGNSGKRMACEIIGIAENKFC